MAEPPQRRDFAMAYMGAIWRSSLTTTQKAICASLVAYANLVDGCPEWDACRPSRARLAAMSGLHSDTIRDHLRVLRERGVLHTRRGPNGGTSSYRLDLGRLQRLRDARLV